MAPSLSPTQRLIYTALGLSGLFLLVALYVRSNHQLPGLEAALLLLSYSLLALTAAWQGRPLHQLLQARPRRLPLLPTTLKQDLTAQREPPL